MIIALVLLLRFLILHHLFEQVAVVCRVLVTGIRLEHLFVGVDRGRQLTLPRQRVAQVVEIAQIVLFRESRRTLRVGTGLVFSHCPPLRILEQVRCIGGVARLEFALGLLVLVEPQVVPERRLGGLAERQHREREHDDPAAPERQCAERQQQQCQPRALLAPPIRCERFVAGFARTHLACHQVVEVAAVRRQRRVAAATAHREFTQPTLLETRDRNAARLIRNEPARELRYRCALLRADTEYRQRVTRFEKVARGTLGRGRRTAVGDEQHLAERRPGLLQKLPALVDGSRRVAAAAWHDVGAQAVDQRRDRVGVARQRRHGEGIGRVDDERRLPARAPFEDIEDLETRTQHAARCNVLRVHGPGQVERDDQRLVGTEYRLLDPLPGGSRQRQHADDPCESEQPPAQIRLAARRARQHVRRQRRVDDALPAARPELTTGQQDRGRDHGRDGPQPLGPEKMKVSRHVSVLRGCDADAAPAAS